LEEHGALFSFTLLDEATEMRRKCWRKYFYDERHFVLDDVLQETGPGCYYCGTPDMNFKLPFVNAIFNKLHSQFESFKHEVMKTKVTCEVINDDDIPLNVLTELFDMQRELMLPDLQKHNVYDDLKQHANEDYLYDFCNLFSNVLGLQLSEQSRIEYTKWAVMRVMKTYKEHPQPFDDEVPFIHCCVWMHSDLLRDILHLFETYEAVYRLKGIEDAHKQCASHFLVAEIPSDKAEALANINLASIDSSVESLAEQDERGIPIDNTYVPANIEPDQSTDNKQTCNTLVTTSTSTEIMVSANEVDSSCESSKKTPMYEKFTSLVKEICLELVPTNDSSELFRKPIEWHILAKQVLLSGGNISNECKECQALKIICELFPCLEIEQSKTNNLSEALRDGNLDSDKVRKAFSDIIECSLDSELQLVAVKSIRQYLVSCLTVDASTRALELPCELVLKRPSFDVHVHRLIVPFSCAVQFEVETNLEMKGKYILTQLIVEPDSKFEGNSLFACLNETTHMLLRQNRIDSPFIIMLIDIFQKCLSDDINTFLSDIEHIVLKSGQVLQKYNPQNGDLRLLIAVAFLKMAMLEARENVALNIWNRTFNGLENYSVVNPIHLFFLRTFEDVKSISKIKENCKSLSSGITSLNNVMWIERYELTCLENNPFYVILDSDRVRLMNTCAVERNENMYEFSKNVKSFISQIVESFDKNHVPIYVNALAVTNLYLSKRRTTDASMKLYASELVLNTSAFSQRQQKFIQCIVGLKKIAVQSYIIDSTTDDEHYMINYVLVTLHAYTLCSNVNSLLMTCLINAPALGKMYLPGFPDTYNLKNTEKYCLPILECACGRILYIKDDSLRNKKCTSCGYELDNSIHLKFIEHIGYVSKHSTGFTGVNINPESLLTRRLTRISPLSSTILQWFIFGSIQGSLAFNFQTEDQVKFVLGCDNPAQYLDVKVMSVWRNLKLLTNFNDLQLGIYLLLIARESSIYLFQDNIALETHAMRCDYEQKVDLIVKRLDESKHVRVHQCIRNCDVSHGLSPESAELKIRESNLPDGKDIANLFRLASCASQHDFITKLFNTVSCNDVPYPFLMSIVEHEQLLYLPQYIYDIVHWHLATVMAINFKLKSHTYLEYEVDKFRKEITDSSLQKIIKTRFETLKKAMKNTNEVSHMFGIRLSSITDGTLLKDCLILDTNSNVYKALHMLVNIQNSFIVKAMQMSFNCRHLQFLCTTENVANVSKISLVEVTTGVLTDASNALEESLKGNLVKLNHSWVDLISVESHSSLKYGCGFDIEYNFDRIEKRLAESLLFGKSVIDLDFNRLPHIVFVDELYKTFFSLVEDIRVACPQQELPVIVEDLIRESASKNNGMPTELINELDVLMTVMKRTKIEPCTLFDTYIDTRRNTIGKHLPVQHLKSTQQTLQVCHIIGLHELLEEICTDQLLDGINDDYKVPLDKSSENHFRNMHLNLKDSFSLEHLEITLKALKRFYYRCIEIGNMDTKQIVAHHLAHESFWPAGVYTKGRLHIKGRDMGISEIISDAICVGNIGSLVALLTEIVKVCLA